MTISRRLKKKVHRFVRNVNIVNVVLLAKTSNMAGLANGYSQNDVFFIITLATDFKLNKGKLWIEPFIVNPKTHYSHLY